MVEDEKLDPEILTEKLRRKVYHYLKDEQKRIRVGII